MRVYLDTLGCRLNQAELERWREELRARGCTPTNDPGEAGLLVLNTCAVTREAARKSRQLIRRTRRRNPRARLVISGCYSTLEREEAAAIAGVDLIVDNRDKEQLAARAVQGLPTAETRNNQERTERTTAHRAHTTGGAKQTAETPGKPERTTEAGHNVHNPLETAIQAICAPAGGGQAIPSVHNPLETATQTIQAIQGNLQPPPEEATGAACAMQDASGPVTRVPAATVSGAVMQAQTQAPMRRRAFVKVQDGCRHRCTFCIVTVARGAERSRPPADIIEQIRQLEEQGVQEVVLSGVHLGGYDSEGPLDALLGRILSDTDMPRLRLGSLEPWTLSDGLLARFSNRRLLPHLHLPLQSGCDRTLKRMARRCRRADFARLLADIRSQNPNCNISTDVIVGFPGENEADWQSSLAFIEEMQFAHCHVFSYSARPGSAAAQFAGQVPKREKKLRNRAARRLSARMREDFLRRQIGRRSTVLWESRDADGRWQGYTENYLRAVLARGQAPAGAISKVRLVSLQATGVLLAREEKTAPRTAPRAAARAR